MPLSVQSFAKVADAAKAVKAKGARYFGGGTLAVRDVNEGVLTFNTLVRSTDKSLRAIKVKNGIASLGSSVTMAEIAGHPDLQSVAAAARAVGGPAIRNMATVGGNLFAEAPYGDFAVALLALDALVIVGRRKFAFPEFLKQREQIRDVVTAVTFDVPSQQDFRFAKVTRIKPKGTSVITIAAQIAVAHGGKVASARIALGCMAKKPMRALAAEQALLGVTLTEQGIAAALAVIAEDTSPITDPVASGWYRREVLPVHFRRLLLNR